MIRTNATWRLVAVAGVAGLILAACGGSDDDGSSQFRRCASIDWHAVVPSRRKRRNWADRQSCLQEP